MEKILDLRVACKKGRQRLFLQHALKKIHAPSLRSLNQFGFNIPYSTLKCYYTEKRFIPKTFFDSLCYSAKLDPTKYVSSYREGNWGQIKGGKISKRKSLKVVG